MKKLRDDRRQLGGIYAHRSANGRINLPDNDNELTRAKLST